MGRLSSSSRGGRIKTTTDTSSIEGLAAIAKKAGFKKEAERAKGKPKLSFFQRLGRGLTAFETGNAVYQSRYEKASFIETFTTDVGKGLKAAFTGRSSSNLLPVLVPVSIATPIFAPAPLTFFWGISWKGCC